MVDFAKNFTSTYRDVPFFVYFAFGHVHTATPNVNPATNPYQGKQYAGCEFVGTTRRGLFGDALAEVDAAVGELAGDGGWLSKLGVERNTLTIFASDNGPSIRWGLAAGSSGIFSGQAAAHANGTRYTNTAKGSTWEGGIRMPAFAHWPGTVPAHSSSAEIVSTLDLLPSLVTLAGGASSLAGVLLDGKASLLDVIMKPQGRSAHKFLPFYNNPAIANASSKIFAARIGAYKVRRACVVAH